ncbi:MAG TPA: PAS domain-containing protein [Candidatus Limnocylindrales bacterium]|nr:PAS domain-containing protein [Candidatus Limnocylindrales bacterium]
MAHDEHHEHLVKELTEQLEPIFSKSPQAIYLYLDDEHKSCNKKLADMLGYKSVQEWVDNEFPISDVAEEDQEKGIEAYMNASRKLIASTINGTLVRKDGKKIKTEITMAPITFKGEVFVLHFISEKK